MAEQPNVNRVHTERHEILTVVRPATVDPFLEILKEFSIFPISTLKPKGRSVLN